MLIRRGKRKRRRIFAPPKSFMAMRINIQPIVWAMLLGLCSCATVLQPEKLTYEGYRITANRQSDTALQLLMQPYRDSVTKNMNDVVGIAEATLEKKKPSGSLGNFAADAMLAMAAKKFGSKVHFAIINYDGLRSPQLVKGPVTRGKIFELMPFDNLLVLQKLNGAQVQELLHFIASLGGWHVAGISMQIKDKKAINILIDGKPLRADEVYTMANSDFVANGGDYATFLKPIPQINNGYLMRDALFDYIAQLKKEGKSVYNNTEMRISHAQ